MRQLGEVDRRDHAARAYKNAHAYKNVYRVCVSQKECTAERSSQTLGVVTVFRNVGGWTLPSIDMPRFELTHTYQVTLEDDMVPWIRAIVPIRASQFEPGRTKGG